MAEPLRRVLAACVLFGAAIASVPAGAVDCRNAVTQNDLNACAADSYNAADARLNAVYRSLMARLDSREQSQLRDAQRAWITARDTECRYTVRSNEGGSIYPMMWSGCLEDQTRKRTRELQAHLDCANGRDDC